jgi:hypothetical protein
MKTLKSLPKDNGLPFFERYASLIHSLTRFAVIAQLVTGLTEIGIIYALLYPSISDLAPSYAASITTPLSILFASLLQVGLKKVFPFSVRAVLFKRWKGLDLPFSIAVFVLTIALLSVSVLLSYKGSHDIIDIAIASPTEKTTTATDSTRAATEREATAIFRTDSATIETKFLGKSEAIKSDYENRASGYDAQASRAKGSIYKAELSAKAQSIRAELKTKLAVLQSDKATELEAKATERKATINRATDKNDNATALILSDNKEAKGKAENRKAKYKNYIGFFVMFCYVFFLIAFVLDEIHKKGSEISETPVLHQRHFAASLFAEWMEAVKARFDTSLRSKIYAFADKTKASPLPNALNPLYDFDAKTYNVWNIETTEPSEKKVIKIPSKTLRIAAKTDTSKTAKTDEIEPKTSRKIGFFADKTDDKKTDTEPSETAKTAIDVTAAVMHEKPQPKTKNCEWCNNSFEYVVYNKKYCCETCKKQAWEAKTGVNFDLELKKKERQKKK